MGNNIATVGWPACGEQDVLERVNGPGVNGPGTSDWSVFSIHYPIPNGSGGSSAIFNFGNSGQTAAQWHTYGMIWSPNRISYYVDDYTQPFYTFTPASLTLPGSVWPFDNGQSNFILLNLAIGGSYPGPPDNTTPFPSEMLIDYVRIYTN